jgi:hypothetical protein
MPNHVVPGRSRSKQQIVNPISIKIGDAHHFEPTSIKARKADLHGILAWIIQWHPSCAPTRNTVLLDDARAR